jgi:hypothetical protein
VHQSGSVVGENPLLDTFQLLFEFNHNEREHGSAPLLRRVCDFGADVGETVSERPNGRNSRWKRRFVPQRFVVPLFQRPYVWNEENQWDPLWDDVVRVADRVLTRPFDKHHPHFLGAVVLQQVQKQTGQMQERTIIAAIASGCPARRTSGSQSGPARDEN